MTRRDFLASAVVAPGLLQDGVGGQDRQTQNREFYELRLYHMRVGGQERAMHEFLRDVAIPAWNRAGVAPVGVFTVLFGLDRPTTYVLLPYKSLDMLSTVGERLAADDAFRKASAGVLAASATAPAYVRAESSLMRAFATIPKLEVPVAVAAKKPRIFELRTYESPSDAAGLKKIEMFDIGEIAIFRRAGLTPVFFGQTLVGPRLPNLTYMLTYDDMAAREKNWAAFAADPEWKKLSTTPGFTDPEIVSSISNTFLRPAPYSQI